MRLAKCLPLVLCLSACAVSGPVSRASVHTGVATEASALYRLDRSRQATLDARVAHQAGAGASRYVVLTSVTRSDRNFPSVTGVWSFGASLPYRRLDRRYVTCGTKTCGREEVGQIRLDRADMERAAQGDGLALEVLGLRDRLAGRLPARAFVDVLGRVDRAHP